MIPSVFLVGAPKCGTTSLYDYLGQHPSVFAPKEKEPNYFNRDIGFSAGEFLDDNEYQSIYEPAAPDQTCIDGCVWNLFSQSASQLIQQATNGQAKIVIVLRPPVSFIESLYHYNILSEVEDLPDINVAIAKEADRKAGREIPPRCPNPERLFYVSLASFGDQVERYYQAFDPQNILVVRQSDLKDQKDSTVGQVYRFIGVDDRFCPTTVSKRGRAHSRLKFLRRWLLKPPAWMKVIGRTLLPTAALRRNTYQFLTRLNSKQATNQEWDPNVLASLKEIFEADLSKLSQVTGRDFSDWNQ